MSILIYGRGYIGSFLQSKLADAHFGMARIHRQGYVREELDQGRFQPRVVVNAAGATGRPNIDALESQPALCFQSNVLGPVMLAETCAAMGIHLVHIGSGCIFDGGPIDETTMPLPRSVYARSKAAADIALQTMPGVAIIRIRMPLGGVPSPRNLIDKLLGYPRVMGDVLNSITVLDDLAKAVAWVIDTKGSGVYHAVNEGPITHRQILNCYSHLVKKHSCEWITEADLGKLTVAPRSNAILLNTRLPPLRDSIEAVEACMQERRKWEP